MGLSNARKKRWVSSRIFLAGMALDVGFIAQRGSFFYIACAQFFGRFFCIACIVQKLFLITVRMGDLIANSLNLSLLVAARSWVKKSNLRGFSQLISVCFSLKRKNFSHRGRKNSGQTLVL